MKMNHTDHDRQRAESIQREAVRLADQARARLDQYAHDLDLPKQRKLAEAAIQDGREQIQQSAEHASDQVARAMASALEAAAGQLRTHTGDGPAAQAARQAAGLLEQGSEQLRPWGARSVLRRMTRVVRHYPLLALLLGAGAFGAAYLANRGRAAAAVASS
jgi:ribosomal 50S subunit-recycling heat shock protein